MKVLMTADTLGGVWTYALELARALERHDVTILLATMGRPLDAAQRRDAMHAPNIELFESAYRLEWMDEPWDDVRAAGEWLLSLEEQHEPDVIHINGYSHGALPWHAPVVVVAHSCVLSWWRAVKGRNAPSIWNAYREAVTRGLSNADLVIAPTHSMLSAITAHYRPLVRSRVVRNGREHIARSAPTKDRCVLSAGRLWDEAKNVSALDAVAHQIPWPIFVAGERQHPNGGVRQLGAAHPLGHLSQDNVARWMRRAAIYALPARYEPFGLSVVDAARAQCALVLGDIDSLRELWSDAALFVPPNDNAALSDTLLSLIADERRRVLFGTRAWKRARKLSARHMAAGYLHAYRQLVSVGRTHRKDVRELTTCAS